jgi:uncharacterized protein YukE
MTTSMLYNHPAMADHANVTRALQAQLEEIRQAMLKELATQRAGWTQHGSDQYELAVLEINKAFAGVNAAILKHGGLIDKVSDAAYASDLFSKAALTGL